MDANAKHVVVIGGGVAGIAAALRLADHGLKITLVETRKRLGGRATSFVDPVTGQLLDNCQHVLMGCCTNLLDLYDRLGVSGHIEWHRRLFFADRCGRIDTMEADDLPAPLHMIRSLLAFKSLSLAQKIAIGRAMFKLMRLGAAGRKNWHGRTFKDWLVVQKQPAGAVARFWSPIVISACNEQIDRVAADYAMQVFCDGFLPNEDAYVMGLSRVPLVQLYDAAEKVISKAGGRVRLAASARQLQYDHGRVTALQVESESDIVADAFISALPFDRLEKICPPHMVHDDPRLQSLGAFDVSPIIGIHLWVDRPVMSLGHLILTDSPLQWIFNKAADTDPPGQHLHGVISAAHQLVNQPAQHIVDMAIHEIGHVLPAARHAQIIHTQVIKEKRATFAPLAGIEQHRPPARGVISNFYLSGDWTRSGWPATMEGAVRSGYLAACALMQDMQRFGSFLAPDLQPTRMYRLLSR